MFITEESLNCAFHYVPDSVSLLPHSNIQSGQQV